MSRHWDRGLSVEDFNRLCHSVLCCGRSGGSGIIALVPCELRARYSLELWQGCCGAKIQGTRRSSPHGSCRVSVSLVLDVGQIKNDSKRGPHQQKLLVLQCASCAFASVSAHLRPSPTTRESIASSAVLENPSASSKSCVMHECLGVPCRAVTSPTPTY